MNLRLLDGKAVNMDRVQHFYVLEPYHDAHTTPSYVCVLAVFGDKSWTSVYTEPVNEIQTVELAQAKCKAWLEGLVGVEM